MHNTNLCPSDCPQIPELLLMVGPAGSGKSTLSHAFASKYVRINQDELGKVEHIHHFLNALGAKHNVIIDRMNFSKEQRNRYLEPAKKAGYKTKIIVLHESSQTCLERMKTRQGHPTIKDEVTARKVLNFFFSKYERPTPDEADEIEFRYPKGEKPLAVICDLDGTLCNIDHRLHFVRGEGKKDWKSFFEALKDDMVNYWCDNILHSLEQGGLKIVLCSGRTDNYEQITMNWLSKWGISYHDLFMRNRQDFREDSIVKEIILDFEILTRYKPYFMIDDRKESLTCGEKGDILVFNAPREIFKWIKL